jgi:hypothetical protein
VKVRAAGLGHLLKKLGQAYLIFYCRLFVAHIERLRRDFMRGRRAMMLAAAAGFR